MYCGFDMGCGPYLAFPKVIFKNMETEITPNKGVQGTRHKVPGPLTPDVGFKKYERITGHSRLVPESLQ